MTRHLIIGGGQAGVSAAARLREVDPQAEITLVSGEAVLPYQRPPLSKAYLSGTMPLERLLLRPTQWFADQQITVRLNETAVTCDPTAKTVRLSGGDTLAYDRLLLATGTTPRRLPAAVGGDLRGVFTLRNTANADAIRPYLQEGNRLIVIGGGYIGLEAAAVARGLGLSVTVIEIAPRILQRVASPETSDFYRALHRGHGVDIRETTAFTRLVGQNGAVTGVELADGELLPADLVLVGIGVTPNDDLALVAGLSVDNGISVDEFCRTDAEHIYAAGDCASFLWRDARVRLESVPHAIHQAETAADNMAGRSRAYVATPWFWSDQYDVKLQIAGLSAGYEATVVRPGRREGAQSIWYYRGEELLAVDAMNDAPSFMLARRIIEAGKTVPRDVAADPTSDLKAWM